MNAELRLGELTDTELGLLAEGMTDLHGIQFRLTRPSELGGYLLLESPPGKVAVDPFVTIPAILLLARQVAEQNTVHVTTNGTRTIPIDPEGCPSLLAR